MRRHSLSALRIGAMVVVAVTVAAFLPTLENGFVDWDDARNFLSNPHFRGLGWAQLRWMLTTAHMGHYIPVTWLTLGLDHVLWGMNPAGYHLTALLLHALNGLLAYLVAWRLLDAAARGQAAGASLAAGAAAAALLFAVHPLRVESVAWISERRDVVSGCFALLTVLAYLAAWRRGSVGRLERRWYWAAAALFALALLSKSIVVGLPLVLLVLDWYPLRRGARGAGRLVLEKAPFLLLSAAASALTLRIGLGQEVLTSLDTLDPAQRLAVSAHGLVFYLGKTLLPWPLSPFYELRHPVLPLSPRYLGSAAIVAALTAALVLARRRWPAGLAAWLAYAILLVPVLGPFHNGYQAAADRYTYLAGLGWALLAGGALLRVLEAARRGFVARRPSRLLLVLAATLIVALAALTTRQIRVWRDSETLWRQALAVEPDSAFARFHLGGTLAAAGRLEEAAALHEEAVARLTDRLPDAKAVFLASLGALRERQGDLAGAERSYRAALGYSPDNVQALSGLGVIRALRGDLGGGLDSLTRALRVAPGYPRACAEARRVASLLGTQPEELARCPRPAGAA